MKILTTKEKIELLEKVKERITAGTSYYICVAIAMVTECEIISNNVKEYIPELFKYKPLTIDKSFGAGWFSSSDKKSRINILDKTIDDIKNK